MFLSRIQLNPARRGGRHLLASHQRIHAAVLAAFPDPPTGSSGEPRVLWRLDQEQHRTWLYVTSPDQPDFTHLVEQAGWPTLEHTWLSRDYDPFLGKLDTGQHWRFRLDANTVHKVRIAKDEPTTRRRAMLSITMRTAWLTSKAEKHGFQIATATSEAGESLGESLTITRSDIASFTKRDVSHTTTQQAVTIAKTTFEGVLTVTDPEAIRHALTRGIGPAKGYGCGLMTLAAG